MVRPNNDQQPDEPHRGRIHSGSGYGYQNPDDESDDDDSFGDQDRYSEGSGGRSHRDEPNEQDGSDDSRQ
jgi:hypothetical protein